ncbi:hypothetical protein SAMN05519103_01924 [Rhizobiales bacterium GAS113]|nr:hypothetical protein SAMN05519103_01924 [Rhizobiales bacterium GAS113]
MKPRVTLRYAFADPQLLGGALPGASWQMWRTLLIASMGEPLLRSERSLFHELTGRDAEPGDCVEELWSIAGRRSGKTRAAATLAAYPGCLCDHKEALAPGERGVLPILAASTTQATRAFNHLVGILTASPILSTEIETQMSDITKLKTGIDVEIRPANFKTIRGITAIGAIADEVAFWNIEGAANPDSEILDALRPALATTGGPLIVISSPYAKRGELYGAFRRHYGANGDRLVLVAKGASRTFNPTLPQKVVDRAYERDAAVASAEYGGEFRNDVAAFVNREVVEACVAPGRYELPPVSGVRYIGFVDPSGGSADAMTLAIGHKDKDGRAILDAVRERRPPFSPEDVVAEFADLLDSYRVHRITGDRYAGEWPRQRFRNLGIAYETAEQVKSDIYRDCLPLLNSGRIELLDNQRLVSQFCGLERRTTRGGRDSIDHPPGAHDDLANSVAGAAVRLAGARAPMVIPPEVLQRSRMLTRRSARFAMGRRCATPSLYREVP